MAWILRDHLSLANLEAGEQCVVSIDDVRVLAELAALPDNHHQSVGDELVDDPFAVGHKRFEAAVEKFAATKRAWVPGDAVAAVL